MHGASVPQHHIKTHAKNKLAYAGMALKVTVQPHQTTAEAQQEHVMKAQAKTAKEEAKQQSINHAAEFEHANMANKDIVDAMPCPLFTPKLWPTSHSQKDTCLTPLTKMSDIEMAEGFDAASFEVPFSKKSITDDSAVESDNTPRPVKKLKVQATAKAVSMAGVKPVGGRAAEKKKRAKCDAEEIVQASDEELPQEPKPKKAKVKLRDEINIATKKIKENKVQNAYVDMLKSSKHAGEDL